jgi:hypothetical protein
VSFESYAAPFTFQHDTRAILDRYSQRLSASELGALSELRAAHADVPAQTYDLLKWKLALQIEQRRLNREMIAHGIRSRDGAEARRNLSAKSAAQKRRQAAPSRDQRPTFVNGEQRAGQSKTNWTPYEAEVPEDRLALAVAMRSM